MANIYDKSSLVLIPSGTKTSKIFSQKPTNGDGDFTFTRSSAATRVNADGNIEKETGNLLLQSNSFDTTWIKASSFTLTSGQSGYDGTNNAWRLESDGSSGYDVVYQSITISGVNTFSIYAKAGTNTNFALRSLSGIDARANFDLSAGSVSTSGSIDASIVSVGGDWYRCSLTFSGSNNAVYIYPNSLGAASAGNIYIQDAQVEEGLVARDYIETTTSAVYGGITDNVPRLDYTDSSCPALLLEPLRTNYVRSSEFYDVSSNYFLSTGTIVEDNFTTSPEGLQNASKVTLSSGTSNYLYTGLSGIAAGDVTISCWAKADSEITIGLNDGNSNPNAIDLTTEWQRFEFTWNYTGGGIGLQLDNYYGVSPASVEKVFYLWGLQAEQGSYPTSYIPTYGSSVTRNVDSGYNSSAASVIGQGEGTIYIETIPLDDLTSYTERLIQFESAGSDFITFQRYANGNITFYGTDGTNTWTIQALNVFSGGTTTKIAGAYKVNDVVLYVNGQSKGTDTSIPTMPNCDRVWFANNISGGFLYIGKHTKVMFFPTRLSNEELAALTTI